MLAPTPRRTPRLLVLVAVLLAGCSVLPESGRPAHLDAEFAVRCLVPDSGRLQVPSTTSDLVVRSLLAAPPPLGEAYDRNGVRWLLYDRGTQVRLNARLRLYGVGPEGWVGRREALFPEAVEWLDPR